MYVRSLPGTRRTLAGVGRRSRRNRARKGYRGCSVYLRMRKSSEKLGMQASASGELRKTDNSSPEVTIGGGLLLWRWRWCSAASKIPRIIQGGRKDAEKEKGQVGGREVGAAHRHS